MILRMTALLSLSALLFACSGSVTDEGTGESTGASQPAAGGTTSGGTGTGAGTGGDKPLTSFECNGEAVKPASVELGLSPRCIGGDPNTNCAPGAPSCAAQDVKFHYAPPALRCIGVDLYEWNGTACVAHNTHGEGGMLKCVGADCDKLFKTKEACDAFAAECPAKK